MTQFRLEYAWRIREPDMTDTCQKVLVELEQDLGDGYRTLTPATRLIEDFSGDQEELSHFVNSLVHRFNVRSPRIDDFGCYIRMLWKHRGFRMSDLHRYVLRKPEIEIKGITIRQFSEILDAGLWPKAMIYPEATGAPDGHT